FGLLRQWGMPLYLCLTPDGYKHVEAAWLSPDALMRRLSFATALGSARLDLATGESKAGGEPLDAQALERALGGLSRKTRAAVDEAPKRLRAALVLGSPEFMRY
ncbi:MAG: DUF1800 family protein, partial [Elusimicrobia bacterium]|nr:DUF1800 family protein [Elusimicrobiota bacterium]